MIKKFKNFDADDFISKKNALKEAVENSELDDNLNPEKVETDIPEDEVISGTAVYENPYLLKIANIISKKLKSSGLGNFSIFHDIVYLNDVPGVLFNEVDGEKHIVCCRDTNAKSISIFNNFEIGGENTAIVTYSTTKLGFKDMLDQLVDDLSQTSPVNEDVVNEAIRYGDGFTIDYVKRFEKLSDDDRDFVYDFIRNYGKKRAIDEYYDLVKSGDPMASRILKAYVGKELAAGDGQARYLMSLADAVVSVATGGSPRGSIQKAVDDGILENLIAAYKGSGPAIATSSGISYEVSDAEAEEEAKRADKIARREAAIKADMENYEETIRGLKDVTEAMCNYVKNNGDLDREDKSVMSRRGVLLTGKGGIGKTYTLKQVLKEKNMAINKDYVWISSGNTTSDTVYQLMYEYNGKLLVFDDAPKLFEGDYRISMWKNALQTDIEDCLIGFPGKDSKLRVYNVMRLKGDRQKKYFTEIGRKSLDDKNEFYKKEMKRHNIKWVTGVHGMPKAVSVDKSLDENEIDFIMSKIDDAWKEEEANAQPAMPNQFIFKGVVVIISNVERERFIEEVGKGNWDAVSSRFINFDIAPGAEALWAVMKKKILEEYNDKSLNDDLCLIPRDMTEEFIEEVEKLLADPMQKYQSINWRTLRMFGDVLRGEKGRRTWKKTLSDELSRQ